MSVANIFVKVPSTGNPAVEVDKINPELYDTTAPPFTGFVTNPLSANLQCKQGVTNYEIREAGIVNTAVLETLQIDLLPGSLQSAVAVNDSLAMKVNKRVGFDADAIVTCGGGLKSVVRTRDTLLPTIQYEFADEKVVYSEQLKHLTVNPPTIPPQPLLPSQGLTVYGTISAQNGGATTTNITAGQVTGTNLSTIGTGSFTAQATAGDATVKASLSGAVGGNVLLTHDAGKSVQVIDSSGNNAPTFKIVKGTSNTVITAGQVNGTSGFQFGGANKITYDPTAGYLELTDGSLAYNQMASSYGEIRDAVGTTALTYDPTSLVLSAPTAGATLTAGSLSVSNAGQTAVYTVGATNIPRINATNALAPTAGGNSGQHLVININGTVYKIALLNN